LSVIRATRSETSYVSVVGVVMPAAAGAQPDRLIVRA
jgi:hypothetical protein